jgi:hypothetical protein
MARLTEFHRQHRGTHALVGVVLLPAIGERVVFDEMSIRESLVVELQIPNNSLWRDRLDWASVPNKNGWFGFTRLWLARAG